LFVQGNQAQTPEPDPVIWPDGDTASPLALLNNDFYIRGLNGSIFATDTELFFVESGTYLKKRCDIRNLGGRGLKDPSHLMSVSRDYVYLTGYDDDEIPGPGFLRVIHRARLEGATCITERIPNHPDVTHTILYEHWFVGPDHFFFPYVLRLHPSFSFLFFSCSFFFSFGLITDGCNGFIFVFISGRDRATGLWRLYFYNGTTATTIGLSDWTLNFDKYPADSDKSVVGRTIKEHFQLVTSLNKQYVAATMRSASQGIVLAIFSASNGWRSPVHVVRTRGRLLYYKL
jgi:hypothetical protein